MPSFITASMSPALAMPLVQAKIASLIIGISTRLETKPGASLTLTGVLPSRSLSARMAAKVASSVWRARMISSGITGTGFMKCMPITDAPPARAARRVSEIDEVFDAKMVCSLTTLAMRANNWALISSFQVAARSPAGSAPAR